jgi:hypothetical protein
MDIDMLGRTSNEEADIVVQIRDILTKDVATDGLAFDIDSIQVERIAEDADYEGIRIRFLATLGSAKINMRIDIGFGDVVKRALKKPSWFIQEGLDLTQIVATIYLTVFFKSFRLN